MSLLIHKSTSVCKEEIHSFPCVPVEQTQNYEKERGKESPIIPGATFQKEKQWIS